MTELIGIPDIMRENGIGRKKATKLIIKCGTLPRAKGEEYLTTRKRWEAFTK